MDDVISTAGMLGSIGTAIATIALVILFWKTVRQLEETVKVSKIQSDYRFRPWVGPSGGIEHMATTSDGKEQFCIAIKNYGEIPSSGVSVKFLTKNEEIKRDVMKSEGVMSFNLGPLLPNMEKRYWFFVDSDFIEKVKGGQGQLFTFLYFAYEYHGGNSGYGAISRFDATMNSFVHIDMWTD